MHERKFSLNEPAKCFIHPPATRQINECYTFQSKSNQGHIDIVNERNLCLSCLKAGHKMSTCRTAKKYSIGKCNERHNEIIHDAFAEGITLHLFGNKTELQTEPWLLIMNIGGDGHSESATVLWDSASTISLITFRKAKELRLSGKAVNLTINKTSGVVEDLRSLQYEVFLKD